MLAQFQASYPVGSLISELLTIYQGKFVVRVSAQVEGVTRATGMAASDSLELAEDQARNRALMVLGMQPLAGAAQSVPSTSQSAENQVQMQAVETAFKPSMKNQSPDATTSGLNDNLAYPSFQASPEAESIPAPAVPANLKENSDAYNDSVLSNSVAPTSQFPEPDAVVENFVTPLVRHSYSLYENPEAVGQIDAEETAVSEPIDLSDAIARTSVELKRLTWSNQQGREYLVKTYGKRSRQELTDEEMLEFLHYLESQPSP